MLQRIQSRTSAEWMADCIANGGVVATTYQTTQQALDDARTARDAARAATAAARAQLAGAETYLAKTVIRAEPCADAERRDPL